MPGNETGVTSVRLVRKLRPSGNSTVLTIPPDVMQELAVEQGDKVVIEVHGDEVRIRKAPGGPG